MEILALHLLAKLFYKMLKRANGDHKKGISQKTI